MSEMLVVKRDGKRQPVMFDKITERLRTLCDGLNQEYINPVLITQKVVEGVYNGVTTSELDNLTVETCAYMSQKHPDFSKLAARIAVSNLQKNTSNSFAATSKVLFEYVDKQGRPAALLSEDVYNFIQENADELDKAVDYNQ